MTTTSIAEHNPLHLDPNLVLETVCDLLAIDTVDIVAAPRISGTAKLALACIAEILRKRNGMKISQIAVRLRLPNHKIRGAIESLDAGHLDTVAAHWEYRSAMHFFAHCCHTIDTEHTSRLAKEAA